MKKKHASSLHLLIIIFLLCNACSPYPQDVQKALQLAHHNTAELEKVLNHYKNLDSLKYEAACFLIANMPYHKSRIEMVLPTEYNDYFAKTDSLYYLYFGDMTAKQIKEFAFRIPDSIRNNLAAKYKILPQPTYSEEKKDIEFITADFLIDNIETAFKMWHSSPLLKDISFDEFKESILPYRTTDEPLLYKKSELQKKFYSVLSMEGMNKITVPIERYKMYILKQQRISYYTDRKNNLELYDLFLPSTEFNCHNQVTWTSNIFRACGIPICYEFTPQWPDRENRHFWSASPDSTGIYIPYSTPMNNLKEDWNDHLKYVGKVYRRTFGVKKQTPYFMKAPKEIIPEIFSVPTLQDETYRYHQTVSLELPFPIMTHNRLAYLSFVTRNGIVPVAWGEINTHTKKTVFQQVPLSMTFILSYYEGDRLKTIGEPFRLVPSNIINNISQPLTTKRNTSTLLLSWNGEELIRTDTKIVENDISYKEFRCDTTKYMDMLLYCKYPLKPHLLKLHKQLKGAYILAGTNIKNKYDTIAVLSEIPKPNWQAIHINSNKKYRYLSIATLNRRPLNIAEIEFWGSEVSSPDSSNVHKLNLEIAETYWNAIDEDVETFVNTPGMEVEMKHPAIIKEVRFIPRTANNMVNIGNLYSLCYFQDGVWKEFARTRAKAHFLMFKDVPVDGLYLLKNLDYEKEELPFSYSEGKQLWISQ